MKSLKPFPQERAGQGHLTPGDEREAMVKIVAELYTAGLITPTGGNVSVRVSGREDRAWITPSGVFKGDLQVDMMVCINLRGEQVDEGAYTASSERFVHCAIYRRRADVQAVIHTHAPNATVLALAEIPFLPISAEAASLGEIPRVPFIMPGTPALGEAVAEALGARGVAVLMQNHGLVVAANSLRHAANITDVIEQTARKILACLAAGKEPSLLPPEAVQQIRESGELVV